MLGLFRGLWSVDCHRTEQDLPAPTDDLCPIAYIHPIFAVHGIDPVIAAYEKS